MGAVSYLNTKPLLNGIQSSPIIDDIQLQIDYPSKIASMLLSDEIDMGLVPVSIIPEMSEYHINTNYCIGCDGAVGSVCLFSEQPLERIGKILLDYQSRTSVVLARILMQEYWHLEPEWVDAGEDFRNQIKGSVAGLVIGDRALEQRKISPYVYDLGEAWKTLTGLPFVFAAWISNRPLPVSFAKSFNEANRLGIENMAEIWSTMQYDVFDLKDYYTRFIQYELDERKRMGLEFFLQKMNTLHSQVPSSK